MSQKTIDPKDLARAIFAAMADQSAERAAAHKRGVYLDDFGAVQDGEPLDDVLIDGTVDLVDVCRRALVLLGLGKAP